MLLGQDPGCAVLVLASISATSTLLMMGKTSPNSLQFTH